MTTAALWRKHRPIALKSASNYRIPGLDPEDVRQEAEIALWEAALSYDPTRGTFTARAKAVVEGRLIDLLRTATRQKRTAIFSHDVEIEDRTDRLAARMELREMLAAFDTRLSNREMWAVIDHLNGVPATVSNSHNAALTRARLKLRAPAEDGGSHRSEMETSDAN